MKTRSWTFLLIGLLILGIVEIWSFKNFNFNHDFSFGQPIDHLNGVSVYYNGDVGKVTGRNTTTDGYNLGKSQQYSPIYFIVDRSAGFAIPIREFQSMIN
ncbi:MAG: hypothetical protein WD398_11555 [Cyclobacteriaceae bacterium]